MFLDTNIVNLLVKYGEQIFEQAPIPEGLDITRAHDVEALMHVFHAGNRNPWDILAARKTLEEIEQTPDPELRADLLDYAVQLVDPPDEQSTFAADFGRRVADSSVLAALPDPADRELLGYAIADQCDVFCTSDRRTIARHRNKLPKLPLRILSPPEWWAHVKPWFRLWA